MANTKFNSHFMYGRMGSQNIQCGYHSIKALSYETCLHILASIKHGMDELINN